MWISRSWWAFLFACCLQVGCTRDPLGNLISQLNDPDVAARRTAARALGRQASADERVITALSKSAADKDPEVRYLSIEALGRVGPAARSITPILVLALADSEKRVRLESALAIAKIDPMNTDFRPPLIAAMREGDGRTLLATGALGAESAWAVPTLVTLLSHASPQVRALAAKTLGRIGPAASGAKLSLEATRRDSNAAAQNAVKDALIRIQPERAKSGT